MHSGKAFPVQKLHANHYTNASGRDLFVVVFPAVFCVTSFVKTQIVFTIQKGKNSFPDFGEVHGGLLGPWGGGGVPRSARKGRWLWAPMALPTQGQ